MTSKMAAVAVATCWLLLSCGNDDPNIREAAYISLEGSRTDASEIFDDLWDTVGTEQRFEDVLAVPGLEYAEVRLEPATGNFGIRILLYGDADPRVRTRINDYVETRSDLSIEWLDLSAEWPDCIGAEWCSTPGEIVTSG